MQTNCKIDEIKKILSKNKLLVDEINISSAIKTNKPEINSSLIQKNDIFICIKGIKTDGHLYAEDAVKRGASLLICEKKLSLDIPQIIVTNSRKAEALIAALYYNTVDIPFKLIGITGTNGKTTISYMINQLMKSFGKKCGVIGTLGYQIGDKLTSLERTTPDALALHKIFAEMKKANIDYVIMEISSHSLFLDRVYGLTFDGAIFTNLTQDHLDFHKTLDDYAKSKYKLFMQTDLDNGISIFNIDDKFGKKFYSEYQGIKKSVSNVVGDVTIKNIKLSTDKSDFSLSISEENADFSTSLIGKYNIYNLSQAIAMVKFITNTPLKNFVKPVTSITPVNGRLHKIENPLGLNIFVDYAHTPDALKNVLFTFYELKKRRIITLFGAGGNRDKTKRPKMYNEALRYSDIVIVTSDNPRDESPIEIIDDILSNGFYKAKTLVCSDRSMAIETSIKIAKKDDIILIAGKGHETYQEIKGEKYHFDDKEEVKKAIDKININKGNLYIPISLLGIYKFFGINDKLKEDKIFYNISTDSRDIKENTLFVALKGEKYNAHNFVKDVLGNSNAFALVNKSYNLQTPRLIKVNDTLNSYAALASYYKTILSPYTIAITGSTGKTTTKEFLDKILSTKYSVHKSHANENNQFGLPKTLFTLKNEEILIAELGTNHFGEIAFLREIAKPDAAIIVNVGNAHLEFFRTLEGVFNEKITLFEKYPQTKIFDGDNELFNSVKGIKVGHKAENDFVIKNVMSDGEFTIFDLNDEIYRIRTPFSQLTQNASMAIVMAKKLNLAYKEISSALSEKIENPLRMEIVGKDGITYLNDCYNANPDSMKAAIEFWKTHYPKSQHVAILGDMLELGENEKKYHEEIGNILKNTKNSLLISVGNLSKLYNTTLHFAGVSEFLSSGMLKAIPKGSVVLIKASHGIKLDKILGGH